MTPAQLKDELIAYSKTIGIDKIGFASADPFLTLKERLQTQQALGYQSGFEEPDIDKRVYPEKILPKARSIISIALAYPSKMKNPPKSKKGERRGVFCRASWGKDYHDILRDRLKKLEDFLLERVPDMKVLSMVDTGALSDRAVAERAGIGWSGKNCGVITPEFGSYVYLGDLVTTIPFPPDIPLTDQCGTCNKCVDACPTGALIQGGQLDSQKCIAFLTQTKGFLPEKYRKKLGNRLYGCDTCQQVCPANKGKNFHFHEEMEPDPEIAKPKLIPLLTMSNREFKEKFGHVSGSWRGKKPIQRNAILALAHFKEEAALPILADLLRQDPRPVIRGTAGWALGKIGGPEVETWLKDALKREKDEDVRAEISRGLEILAYGDSGNGKETEDSIR
ncbi:tRNA epoxyqueuosine(34) reductase QueG [Halalkalibacterium halodurans]|uniref:Epoxyqueuosine reductase n=1 Tax=Halalkalibacterium halodurans (strain ATCC BAA-125 / DSM 18197 / FERM 7344 / JCM 9153 / C-125) TaxID=272558 RepID=Q9KE38_HALH5|nr:tRNA epoxyqueuosine(34) reductase QueG [Halalkalibacterium halodurans]MED4080488.1 tRNA epoxyqueuosine(34) reductase QueG [Halalkalibacterium halodurans]MED4086499.1 tRNA epoxyqueuosine(34) reductase QueG [Halalkalibacterium halodurans]MED4104792.1 tRNA epoxyqueuosine(34) reductase QueG [Halalkalibacterium halodurans]MED4109631.1 tRNA epoxyqueuosine(34) reductase QueG [Halalkalibacterium halodurans]MED4150090.1 tRNA epoxyqueuosine(34) reductase QueG [Halalkalibacterium halodurans]